MNKSLSSTVIRLAIALGISISLGVVCYWLSFYVFNNVPLLGSRTFIAIGALLNLALCWQLRLEFRNLWSWIKYFALFMGWSGSIIVCIGATFDFLNTGVQRDLINWFPLSQTQSIIAVGYGFIGIWLLLLNFHSGLSSTGLTSLTWLGIISGIFMAMGLFAIPRVFIPYVSLYHQFVPELGELVSSSGWMILYPIWSICFGSVATADQHGDQVLRSLV